jgi:hypothetical protein
VIAHALDHLFGLLPMLASFVLITLRQMETRGFQMIISRLFASLFWETVSQK